MKTFGNIFLILFLNVAGLGIADALLSQKLGISFLAPLHSFAYGLSVFFGLVIYFGFALNRHLPKTVLLPPLAFLFWGLLDFWPLENLVGDNYQLFAAVAQLLLGLLVLQLNLALNKKVGCWCSVSSPGRDSVAATCSAFFCSISPCFRWCWCCSLLPQPAA